MENFFFLPKEKQLLIDLHCRPRTPSRPPPAEPLLISLLDKRASGQALALKVWRRVGRRYAQAEPETGASVQRGQVRSGLRQESSDLKATWRPRVCSGAWQGWPVSLRSKFCHCPLQSPSQCSDRLWGHIPYKVTGPRRI